MSSFKVMAVWKCELGVIITYFANSHLLLDMCVLESGIAIDQAAPKADFWKRVYYEPNTRLLGISGH